MKSVIRLRLTYDDCFTWKSFVCAWLNHKMWNIEIHHTRIENEFGHQDCAKVFNFSKTVNLLTLNNQVLDREVARFKVDSWEIVDLADFDQWTNHRKRSFECRIMEYKTASHGDIFLRLCSYMKSVSSKKRLILKNISKVFPATINPIIKESLELARDERPKIDGSSMYAALQSFIHDILVKEIDVRKSVNILFLIKNDMWDKYEIENTYQLFYDRL